MNLYLCSYDEEEWVCYVFAETRGKAKYLFHKFWCSGDELDFTQVRSNFIGKSESIEMPSVVDREAHENYHAVLELCNGYLPEEDK